MNIGRKCRFNGLHFLEDTLDDIYGVCTGLFLDDYLSRTPAVGDSLLFFFLLTINDSSDIPEIYRVAILVGKHHVQKFRRVLELFLDTERE